MMKDMDLFKVSDDEALERVKRDGMELRLIEFDDLRKNRVEVSYYKYGPIKENYGKGYINALESHDRAIKKYIETGNTEYLCDAANYLMFEFMYPQKAGAYFKATDSGESAGVVGMGIREIERFREEADL